MASKSLDRRTVLKGVLATGATVTIPLPLLQIMLNGTGVAFVAAGSRWGQPDGQIMFLFILAMAAAEVSVGLALVLRLYHLHHNLDADAANEMRG